MGYLAADVQFALQLLKQEYERQPKTAAWDALGAAGQIQLIKGQVLQQLRGWERLIEELDLSGELQHWESVRRGVE